MSFDHYMQSMGNIDVMDMTEKEKEGALNAYLTDPDKKEYVMQAVSDYLLDDHHIASALLLPDAQCGASLKDSFYAAMEADMQDCIDGLK